MYLSYLLYFAAPNMLSLAVLLLFIFAYFIYCAFLNRKPELTLYGFMLIYLFIPHSGDNFGSIVVINEFKEVTISNILLAAASSAIALRMILDGKILSNVPVAVKILLYLLSLIVLLCFIGDFSLLLRFDLDSIPFGSESIIWAAPLSFSVIFFLGCLNYLDQTKKIETALIILWLAGIEISLEAIFYHYFQIGLPLSGRALHWSGRFIGVVFADYIALTEICLAALAASLYLGLTKRPIFYFSLPLVMLALLSTYQRASLASGIIVLSTFYILYAKYRRKTVHIWALVAASLFAVVFGDYLLTIANRIMSTSIRPDFFSENTLTSATLSRIGAYIRGLEVFVYSFPWGVGHGKVVHYMISPNVDSMLFEHLNSEFVTRYYLNIAQRIHITGPHNFFVMFLAEYGLLALLAIIAMFWYIVSFFKRFISTRRVAILNNDFRDTAIKITGFSFLFGEIFHMFYQHQTGYWPLWIFVFMIGNKNSAELKNNPAKYDGAFDAH